MEQGTPENRLNGKRPKEDAMTLTACLFALFCSLLLPAGAGTYLALRTKKAAPVLLGAACFTVFQLLTRLPLLQLVLPRWAGYVLFQSEHPVWYLLLLSLSAGVFEECGRYLVMRRFLRTGGPVDAVSFGVGHGGLEAAALVGVSLAYLLFSGGYLAQPAGSLFLAGAERLFAMTAHVGFSVLVWCGVRGKRPLLLPAAVALHGALDFLAVLLARSAGAWLTELVAAVFALAVLAGSLILQKNMTNRGEIA
jgi:uncharacterized membrane protein YhfC